MIPSTQILNSVFAATIFLLGACNAVAEGNQSARAAVTKQSAGLMMAQLGVKPAVVPDELDALVRSAKAEGELLWYVGTVDVMNKRVGDAFTAKYGIKTTFLRLGSTQLVQRYSSEAEAGTFAADMLVISTQSPAFFAEAIKKGWIYPISQANLPVLRSGEYPSALSNGMTATVQINPWVIGYDSEKLKGADVPKDWPDLLNPRYKGQILLVDPRVGAHYLYLYSILSERYGKDFLARLRAQQPRAFNQSSLAIQALAAGEGVMLVPTAGQQIKEPNERGAKLALMQFDFTTGSQIEVILTAPAKAKHPNAARLFANFIMSSEGNKIYAADPSTVGIYDTAALPKQYQPLKHVPGLEEAVRQLGL